MRKYPKQRPKWLINVLLALGAGVLVYILFRPSPIPVDIGQVTRGPLEVTVEAEGKTRVRSRYEVASPVAGRVSRISLEAGDFVKQGEMVAQIDPLPLTSQVQAAQAQLEELEAQLAGVETLRPKKSALAQAEARIAEKQAQLRQIEARIVEAEAALDQAQRDLQRSKELYPQGVIPRQQMKSDQLLVTIRAQELEGVRREAESAAFQVKAAQKALDILVAEQQDPDYLLDVYEAQMAGIRAELANLADEARRTDISAPVSGAVLQVVQKSDRYIDAGTVLLILGNTEQLELVIDVLSSDAVRIEPGDSIYIEHWGENRTLEARVRLVEPSAFTKVSALGVDEQRVNIIGDFVDSEVPLGDGYRVEARIVVWQQDNVLKVPLSALFRCNLEIATNPGWCVFVVNDGVARQQQVKLGERTDLEGVILSGLSQNDTVILHPTGQIEDGKAVKSR